MHRKETTIQFKQSMAIFYCMHFFLSNKNVRKMEALCTGWLILYSFFVSFCALSLLNQPVCSHSHHRHSYWIWRVDLIAISHSALHIILRILDFYKFSFVKWRKWQGKNHWFVQPLKKATFTTSLAHLSLS